MGRVDSEVNLYCRKVLIQAKAKGIFPEWLRFLKGVVDSEDLPLNISRETMQDTSLMQKLNKVLTGRFLKFLDEQAEKDADAYGKFYAEYQRFLKEGVVTDFTHKHALGKLLRYESSAMDQGKLTSLAEYVKRMPPEQKEIFCLLAPNRAAAEASPYFEVFKERKFEVLFLHDPWDEFVMEHLHEFDGKLLKLAEKADLDVAGARKEGALSEDAAKALAQWLKETLGDKVGEVRVSKRLVESPAVGGGRGQVHDFKHEAHHEGPQEGRRGSCASEARPGNQPGASHPEATGGDPAKGRRVSRERGRANPRQCPCRRRSARRPACHARPVEPVARKGADAGVNMRRTSR